MAEGTAKGKGPEMYLTRERTHAEVSAQEGGEQNADRGSKGKGMSHGGGRERSISANATQRADQQRTERGLSERVPRRLVATLTRRRYAGGGGQNPNYSQSREEWEEKKE